MLSEDAGHLHKDFIVSGIQLHLLRVLGWCRILDGRNGVMIRVLISVW